jgi:type III restriction enzyme
MFEEEFLILRENYQQFKNVDPKNVHKGYFASRKYKGEIIYEDTNGKNEKNDKEAYDLIMKNKERLLSFDEKVSFIFSHSALKEGWDNPNIFQICTLRDDTANQMKKRQEIGRGLRICLDVNGDRVMEEDKNILTVISNSSYQKYASSLQEEFREDGYKDEDKIEIRDKKRKRIKVSKTELLKMADFLELWKRISKKTRWSIEILPNLLVEKVVEELEKINSERSFVNIERGQIYFDNQGDVKTVRENTAIGYGIKKKFVIENFIERLIEETGMTRKTIFDILRKVSNKSFILENPEHYIRNFSAIVKYKLKNIMLNNGLKYSETGEFWQIENIFKEFEAFPERLLESKRSVFDYVEFDSFGEKKFAESLEILSGVKVYTKLPRGFVVDTPIGKYIPDWAIVLEVRGEEKLYLVRETKFDYERIEDITESEREKINCAKKHFEAIGFSGENGNFKLVQDKELGDLV